MSHHCDALVVVCIDFRFQKYIRRWTDDNLVHKTFDLVGFAGSTKELDLILSQVDISVNLHHISQTILIHHQECGAYGSESTPQRHIHDLQLAKEAILNKYPQLQVDLYYLHLDGTFEQVKP